MTRRSNGYCRISSASTPEGAAFARRDGTPPAAATGGIGSVVTTLRESRSEPDAGCGGISAEPLSGFPAGTTASSDAVTGDTDAGTAGSLDRIAVILGALLACSTTFGIGEPRIARGATTGEVGGTPAVRGGAANTAWTGVTTALRRGWMDGIACQKTARCNATDTPIAQSNEEGRKRATPAALRNTQSERA